MTRAGKKKVGRRMKRTSMCDLPPKLVGEKILTKIPLTSLRTVRSTCKLWKALTKDWILGKASAARQQFLGFMTMDSKVCSVRFHLCRSKDKEDLIDLSIKQVDLLNQVEISKVYHCDGLLLCVAKDNSRLVVWNPYLGQTRWIRPRTESNIGDSYALGYDINRNHKILRMAQTRNVCVSRYEIYDLRSNSWRVLEVTPNGEMDPNHRLYGVSVKGNTYFFAHEDSQSVETDEDGEITDLEDFLLCFDFTTETFGLRLPLPFHSTIDATVTLSCVRDQQLAVLYHNEGLHSDDRFTTVEFWVTTSIESNSVSWSKFLTVDMRPIALAGVLFDNYMGATFFIDEEEKVAVVFDLDGYLRTESARYHTAFISGKDGFFKPVTLGVAPNVGKPCPRTGHIPTTYRPPLVCSSSYLPSLVQVNQQRKRKERDV
ncbi:unnamed protein product [Arabidopsis halleri]